MRRMRILVAFIVLLVAHVVSMAQTAEDESSRLLAHLGVDKATKVTPSPAPGIPYLSPIKVYLAFGLDMKVRDNFLGWIKKWNEKDAKKYGDLVVVERFEDADLAFVRMILNDQKVRHFDTKVSSERVNSTSTTTASAKSGESYANGRSETSVRGEAIVTQPYTYDTVPLYAYIIRRKDQGFEILWRYTDNITTREAVENSGSGRQLFDDFKKLAKDRPRLK